MLLGEWDWEDAYPTDLPMPLTPVDDNDTRFPDTVASKVLSAIIDGGRAKSIYAGEASPVSDICHKGTSFSTS